MILHATPLSGLMLVELTPQSDERGAFTRWYCERELAPALQGRKIVQANHSMTRQVGAVRGMHYQHPASAEIKLIRCIRGGIFDVVVDLRSGSDTFLDWFGVDLQEGDSQLLLVPEGCAHGFQVLEGNAEVLYLHTAYYEPGHEGGVRYDDPAIGIKWPHQPCDLSVRDRQHALLDARFSGLDFS